jgi:hypothetical protein
MAKKTKPKKGGVNGRSVEDARSIAAVRRLRRAVRDQKLIVKLSRELKRRIDTADSELLDLARIIADRHEMTEPEELSTEDQDDITRRAEGL